MFNKKLSDHFQKTWAAVAVGAVSIGVGVVKGAKAKKEAKAAQGKIQPYKTPQEVIDVLEATQYNAQSGFDASTLDYLTNQTDSAFAGSLGIVQRLGGDQNAMSAIFGQQVDNIKSIATQDHQLRMQNFSTYVNAQNAVGANSAAEQKSAQDLLRDQLQQIANEKAIAAGQISQGVNAGISAAATYGMNQLYNPDGTLKVPKNKQLETTYAATVAQQNAQNTRGFNP